jgi:hypothetical protein
LLGIIFYVSKELLNSLTQSQICSKCIRIIEYFCKWGFDIEKWYTYIFYTYQYLIHIFIQSSFKSTIKFVRFNVSPINLIMNLKIKYIKHAYKKYIYIIFLWYNVLASPFSRLDYVNFVPHCKRKLQFQLRKRPLSFFLYHHLLWEKIFYGS